MAKAESAAPSSDRPTAYESLEDSGGVENTTDYESLEDSGGIENPLEPGWRDPRASAFPVRLEAVVGEQLSIVPSLRKPGIHCQVLATQGRVGSISVFGRQMARLACAHGAWILKKSRTGSRGFRIESAEHEQVGRYLRRPWLSGGTIRLTDGTEVMLRRSLSRRWEVRSADGSECLAEIHRSAIRPAQPQQLKLTIHSVATGAAQASMLILAACALLMLAADSG